MLTKNQLHILLQRLVPQHLLSRLLGGLARCQTPWIKNQFISWFVQQYQVDMSSALQPDPLQYPDFNSFFTRRLKPEARPIAFGEHNIICPADGKISQLGNLEQNRILQAKNFDYDVTQLLGGDAERAQPFANGRFITIYLAPKDYHRVHIPYSGTLKEMVYVPGTLFSVNTHTANTIPNLFARNERVVCLFDTAMGPMAVILVGAIIVASISTVWAQTIAPSTLRQTITHRYTDNQIQLDQGEEMGHFMMGSTVIVVFANQQVTWSPALSAGQSVQFGQKLGQINT